MVWHNVTFTDTSKKATFLKIPFFGFPVSSVGQGHLQAAPLHSTWHRGGLKSRASKQCWEGVARNSLRSALFFLPWRVNATETYYVNRLGQGRFLVIHSKIHLWEFHKFSCKMGSSSTLLSQAMRSLIQ